MRDNMKIVRDRFAAKRAEEEALLPFYKRWFAKLIRWIKSSDGTMLTIVMCIVWPIAMIPVGLFWVLWGILGPTTFWPKFATIVFIGGPLFIPQIFLLFVAMAITFGVLAEVLDW